MNDPRLIDRKELARRIGVVTVRQIAHNEHDWGIDRFKVRINRGTCTFYERAPTLRVLNSRGLV